MDAFCSILFTRKPRDTCEGHNLNKNSKVAKRVLKLGHTFEPVGLRYGIIGDQCDQIRRNFAT